MALGGVPLAELIPRRFRPSQLAWRAAVGATLADVTREVGVRDGVLRVVAANDAARREVEARCDHVLAAWNAAAGSVGARPARDLRCWVGATDVAAEPRAGRPGPGPNPRTAAPVAPAFVAVAASEMAAVRDPGVRAALIAARSRALSRGAGLAPADGAGSTGPPDAAAASAGGAPDDDPREEAG